MPQFGIFDTDRKPQKLRGGGQDFLTRAISAFSPDERRRLAREEERRVRRQNDNRRARVRRLRVANKRLLPERGLLQ